MKCSGEIKIEFENNKYISVFLENGIVKDFNSNLNSEDIVTTVNFLSKNFRTFDQINSYLRVRSGIKKSNNISEEELTNKLCDIYKLYDIVYIERLIKKCPFDNFEILKSIEEFGIKEIESINFDIDELYFYARMNDGSLKKLNQLGSGEQSIISMILGSA